MYKIVEVLSPILKNKLFCCILVCALVANVWQGEFLDVAAMGLMLFIAVPIFISALYKAIIWFIYNKVVGWNRLLGFAPVATGLILALALFQQTLFFINMRTIFEAKPAVAAYLLACSKKGCPAENGLIVDGKKITVNQWPDPTDQTNQTGEFDLTTGIATTHFRYAIKDERCVMLQAHYFVGKEKDFCL